MRERVALFGGEISAGRMPAGGYKVHVRIPLKDDLG
jgi:signal transduction histidine kinase